MDSTSRGNHKLGRKQGLHFPDALTGYWKFIVWEPNTSLGYRSTFRGCIRILRLTLINDVVCFSYSWQVSYEILTIASDTCLKSFVFYFPALRFIHSICFFLELTEGPCSATTHSGANFSPCTCCCCPGSLFWCIHHVEFFFLLQLSTWRNFMLPYWNRDSDIPASKWRPAGCWA